MKYAALAYSLLAPAVLGLQGTKPPSQDGHNPYLDDDTSTDISNPPAQTLDSADTLPKVPKPKPFFAECTSQKCYTDLESLTNSSALLGAFCHNSLHDKKSLSGVFNFATNSSQCGDVSQIDTIQAACDCVAKQAPVEQEGTATNRIDAPEDKKPQEVPSKVDPSFDSSHYFCPECKDLAFYSFLDISADSKDELKQFCDKSKGGAVASDVLDGVDENSLVEHAPNAQEKLDTKQLEETCGCILKSKD